MGGFLARLKPCGCYEAKGICGVFGSWAASVRDGNAPRCAVECDRPVAENIPADQTCEVWLADEVSGKNTDGFDGAETGIGKTDCSSVLPTGVLRAEGPNASLARLVELAVASKCLADNRYGRTCIEQCFHFHRWGAGQALCGPSVDYILGIHH